MAKKIKVKTKAVFNGQPIGSTMEVDEGFARKYEAMKYLDIIGEVEQPKPVKKESAPKKPAKEASKKKDEGKKKE